MLKKKLSGIMATMLAVCALPAAAFAEQRTEVIDQQPIQSINIGNDDLRPSWLAAGVHTQYPAEGGVWEYGFWNAKVRSYYYHAERCHGSTVELNGDRVRSADTAKGRTSIAEKWAVQWPSNDDRYWYRICD